LTTLVYTAFIEQGQSHPQPNTHYDWQSLWLSNGRGGGRGRADVERKTLNLDSVYELKKLGFVLNCLYVVVVLVVV